MVAASPCALAVAPLAYATAISSCARKGILLKGGQVLDALASCHTIAFDKTGTLTTGGLMFKAIEPIYGHLIRNNRTNFTSCCIPSCEKEALAVAAAMEKGTTHPIGRAVVDHSIGKDLPSVSVESFEYFPGKGLVATLNNIESGTGGGKLLKASLGSVEFIASLCKSEDESRKIKEAVNASSYGRDFVHAALSVEEKVTLIHLLVQVLVYAILANSSNIFSKNKTRSFSFKPARSLSIRGFLDAISDIPLGSSEPSPSRGSGSVTQDSIFDGYGS